MRAVSEKSPHSDGPEWPVQYQTQTMALIKPLESPFGWKKDNYTVVHILSLPVHTISFTATRLSKILGYVLLVGTVIGLYRIFEGIREYRLFNQIHLHNLSQRSIQWIVRGLLEIIPVVGGLSCLLIDIITTIYHRTNSPQHERFPDDYVKCPKCKNLE